MTSEQIPVPPLAQVLGRLPSGLFILTARQAECETGILVSWVMQAGFVPPALTVAIRKGRYIADWLTEGSPFVLNLLEQGDSRWLRYFARGFAPGCDPISDLNVRRSPDGIAVLPDTLGYVECVPCGHVDSGDHRIFLADVMGGELLSARTPMIHIRRTGMNY